MTPGLPGPLATDPVAGLAAGLALVLVGAAVQVAVGAGLSVVAGPFLLLWLGPATGVPVLLGLNLLVSVAATIRDGRSARREDVLLASGATLAGCALASPFAGLPDAVLKGLTAVVLLAVALPRPPPPDRVPSPAAGAAGVALAGLLAGALTVWTATPGPIIPVALARAGRSGADIRRTMQPISTVGFGAALAWVGLRGPGLPGGLVAGGSSALLAGATLAGVAAGFLLRPRIDPGRVILLVRIVAAAAAILLVASVLR